MSHDMPWQDYPSSSGNESDTSSIHSHIKRKMAVAMAAAGGIALGATAIHSYRNRSRSQSQSRSRSSSLDLASRARDNGKKGAIRAGVATLVLGAGVAGTAAYIHRKRKEHIRKDERGPFVAKLVGRKYGKLDPSDPFGLRRHEHPLGGSATHSTATGSSMSSQHSSHHFQQHASSQHHCGTAALGGAARAVLAGGLLYGHQQCQKHSRSYSDPPRPPPHCQLAPNPFSASPSPQFMDQMSHSSHSDPFGNSPGYSKFASYMGEKSGSLVSPAGVPAGGGGYTSSSFRTQGYGIAYGSGDGYASKEDDLSCRFHTSLNLCDDTSSCPVRETRDPEYGSSRSSFSSSTSSTSFFSSEPTFSSSASSHTSDTSIPSILGGHCGCGCRGDAEKVRQTTMGANINIFALINGPTSGGESCNLDVSMTGVSECCGRNGGDTFVRSAREAGFCSSQELAYR